MREELDILPDQPIEFGYKCAWLAIPTDRTAAVVDALQLQQPLPSTWRRGIDVAYGDESVFVSPPVAGWTFVIGQSLPWSEDPAWLPFLLVLSRTFGHVQFYSTHRVVEYHTWARVEHGQVVRAYSWVGESGRTLLDVGEKTPEEIELGFNFNHEQDSAVDNENDVSEEDDDEYWDRMYPNEESVMSIAGKWSIHPGSLSEYPSTGFGVVGRLRQGSPQSEVLG